ncbi:MAG: hypothetical protein IJX53_01060, partial [Clostridia bacterium]|nr:hypothetical protein [Clostridia bacterium]
QYYALYSCCCSIFNDQSSSSFSQVFPRGDLIIISHPKRFVKRFFKLFSKVFFNRSSVRRVRRSRDSFDIITHTPRFVNTFLQISSHFADFRQNARSALPALRAF